VISLEPRTLHQPGKLQNMSKNDYLFTLSVYAVNEKRALVCPLNSIACSSFTSE